MKIATQTDLNDFYAKALLDKNIYPYLSTSKFISAPEVPKDDWTGIYFVSEDLKCMLKVTFDRSRDIEMSISLYSYSPFLAGKAIFIVRDLVNRYGVRAINSVVHSSNYLSIKIHKKMFGDPWGIEEKIAWNSLTGQYEDLIYFRKMIS